jgi:transposase
VELRLGPGQEADVTRGEELLASHEPEHVIADKGYDSDELVAAIVERGAKAVTPPRGNRLKKRRYSRPRYRTRNLVERFINRRKHYYCRIATRCEKTVRNYLMFVNLAALVSLGVTVNMT